MLITAAQCCTRLSSSAAENHRVVPLLMSLATSGLAQIGSRLSKVHEGIFKRCFGFELVVVSTSGSFTRWKITVWSWQDHVSRNDLGWHYCVVLPQVELWRKGGWARWMFTQIWTNFKSLAMLSRLNCNLIHHTDCDEPSLDQDVNFHFSPCISCVFDISMLTWWPALHAIQLVSRGPTHLDLFNPSYLRRNKFCGIVAASCCQCGYS